MALFASLPLRAGEPPLVLDAPFSDHAVLQRGRPVTVHGRAKAGEAVTVTFAGISSTVRTGSTGAWQATFPAQRAARGLSLVARAGERSAAAQDLSVGDVFLCSGQSNMQFALADATLRPEDRRRPADAALHLLTIAHEQSRVARSSFATAPTWQTAAQAGADFSAVCYLMGRELAQARHVAIGLIDSSWGGTPIESWLPYEGLVRAGAPPGELEVLAAFRKDPVAAESRFGASLDARWEKPAEQGGRINFGNLHNAMIAPLKDFPLAGAVWYQGEANANRGDSTAAYRAKLAALVQSWREQFEADLPVVIVQLAGFGKLTAAPEANSWPDVREAQREVAESDPHAGLVVTTDVSERLTIHPPLKLPVAQRAAAAMSDLLAGGSGEIGPRVEHARLERQTIKMPVVGAKGTLIAASWGRPGPFVVCGENGGLRQCRFADAELAGDELAVQVPSGLTAERIRYCYAAAPICNVFDTAGNPLGPFEIAVR